MDTVDRLLPLLLAPMRFAWHRLPGRVLDTRAMRRLGALVHARCMRHTDRTQSHFTCFLRNRPQLEVLAGLLAQRPHGATVRIVSLGCSAGQELYSALWVLRTARPDLRVAAVGIDVTAHELALARRGVYDPAKPQAEGAVYTFEGPRILAATDEPLPGLLEPAPGGGVRVCDWLREGVEFRVGDACDPALADALGPQDVVFACNFLGPMDDDAAASCLRRFVRLLAPGGVLVLDGMDLDLKGRVVPTLGLEPVTARIAEIHRADPSKRDWPWHRWSLEPLDLERADWAVRYATLFRAPGPATTPPSPGRGFHRVSPTPPGGSMDKQDFVATATTSIDAPRHAVWEALVSREALKAYMFGADVDSDWQEGSPITWRGEMHGKRFEDTGQVLRAEPDDLLQYSHASGSAGKAGAANRHTVTIRLSGEGDRTHVSLSQDNNADEKARAESQKNWTAMLAGLKDYVEKH